MSGFSWSDSIRACLPCLHTPSLSPSSPTNSAPPSPTLLPQRFHDAINRVPRARPDELNGLLRSSSASDEDDAISMLSRHSRQIHKRLKRKAKGRGKGKGKQKDREGIQVFGWSLFGRSVRLEGGDEALYAGQSRGVEGDETATRATFDSDAAPLDVDLIADLSLSLPSAPSHAPGAQPLVDFSTPSPTEPSPITPSTTTPSSNHPHPHKKHKHKTRNQNETSPERLERKRQKHERKLEKARLAAALERSTMQDGEEFEGFIGSGGGVVTSSSGSGTGTGSASVSGSGGGSGSGSGGPRSLVKSPAQALQEMQIHEDEAQAADLDGIVYTRSVRSHPGPSGGGSDSRSRTSLSVSDRPGLGGMNRNATTTTTSGTGTGTGTGSSTRSKRSHSSTTSFSLSLSHSNSNSVSGPVSPMDPLSPPPVSPTTEKNMKKKRRDTTGSLHPRSPSRSRSKSQTTNSLNKEDEVPPLHSLPLPPLSPFKQTQMQTRSGVSCPGAHSSSSLSVPTAEGGTANGNGDEGKGEGSFPSTGFSSRSRSGSALGSAMGALMLARRGDEFEGY